MWISLQRVCGNEKKKVHVRNCDSILKCASYCDIEQTRSDKMWGPEARGECISLPICHSKYKMEGIRQMFGDPSPPCTEDLEHNFTKFMTVCCPTHCLIIQALSTLTALEKNLQYPTAAMSWNSENVAWKFNHYWVADAGSMNLNLKWVEKRERNFSSCVNLRSLRFYVHIDRSNEEEKDEIHLPAIIGMANEQWVEKSIIKIRIEFHC